MAQIDAFFYMVAEQNASDLHLSSGSQPIVRINPQGEQELAKAAQVYVFRNLQRVAVDELAKTLAAMEQEARDRAALT